MTGRLHAGLSVLKGILECKRHRRPLSEPLTWEGELPLTLQRFPGALDYSEVPFIIPGVSSQTHGSRCPAISELGALLFGAAGGGEAGVGSPTPEMQECSPLEQLHAAASVSLQAPGSPPPGL